MSPRVLIGLALAALGLSLTAWLVLRPRPVRLHPGRVEVVLIDRFGHPWARAATVQLGDQWFTIGVGGRAGPFEVAEGTARFVAKPAPVGGCGTFEPFENGRFDVRVSGGEAPGVQLLEVTLGPTMAEALREEAQQELDRQRETRDVTLQLLWPDGGPAAGVRASCDQVLTASDRSGLVDCGPRRGSVQVAAGDGAFGARGFVADTERETTLVLGPSLQLDLTFLLPDGGPVPETAGPIDRELTLNSKDIRASLFPRGAQLFVPGVPPTRTIVCVHEQRGALGSACEVVVADGGATVPLVLVPDRGGTITFDATVAGQPLKDPVLYLDRAQRPASTTGPKQSHGVEPGAHVLVLNTKSGPERYEAVVRVAPGQTLDLGTLELK
ncbi:MAG: hypothetical protein U0228_06150 [Myxococcaceae bacterium]